MKRDILCRSAISFFILPAAISFIAGTDTYAQGLGVKTATELYQEADLVLVGEVVQIEQTMNTTLAQIEPGELLKGSPEGPIVIFSPGGRAFPAKEAPVFSSSQNALFFLIKKESRYECLYGAQGMKLIRNDNIYPYANDSFSSQPLKAYLKALPSSNKDK